MRYPYPDITQIIEYGGFWRNLVQRWRLRQGRAEYKLKVSGQRQAQQKNILTELSDNDLCLR